MGAALCERIAGARGRAGIELAPSRAA